MLSRIHRFHGHKTITRVNGASFHDELFSVKVAKNSKGDFRVAVVVSKKVAPHAVTRNRIRRRVFETIRKSGRLQGLPVDVIVYIKSANMATTKQDILDATLVGLLKKGLQRL